MGGPWCAPIEKVTLYGWSMVCPHREGYSMHYPTENLQTADVLLLIDSV